MERAARGVPDEVRPAEPDQQRTGVGSLTAPVLAAERITAEGRAPGRWLFVLHGVYGAGRNWASVVRRLIRERPELGAWLVDLREHGGSRGFEPPHTLARAAEDLGGLAEAVGVRPEAVLGHSFGGKVALRYAAGAPAGLRQVWVLDSTPSAREPSGSAWDMLAVLRSLPGPFGDREAAIEALTGKGVADPVARWMATNLERSDGGGLTWRFDLDAIEELLRDFFREDLWRVVESPPEGLEVHLVKAEESGVLTAEDQRRADDAARSSGRVHLHRLSGGHWLNAENPDGLLGLWREHL